MRSRLIGAAFAVAAAGIAIHEQQQHSKPQLPFYSSQGYKSPQAANDHLNEFCNEDHMSTREGQAQCIQETNGQVFDYASQFYNDLNLTPANIKERMSELGMDKGEDAVSMISYGKTCATLMNDLIYINNTLSYGYKTALNLPEYCVSKALDLSAHYKDILVNKEEGQRLRDHLDRLEKYYRQHPKIPPSARTEPHEKEHFPKFSTGDAPKLST